jgi:hypothetical protein
MAPKEVHRVTTLHPPLPGLSDQVRGGAAVTSIRRWRRDLSSRPTPRTDEQADAAVGGGAGQDGQHREQQQGSEAVALALAAAWVGDLVQGGLRGEGLALNSLGAPLVSWPPAPP